MLENLIGLFLREFLWSLLSSLVFLIMFKFYNNLLFHINIAVLIGTYLNEKHSDLIALDIISTKNHQIMYHKAKGKCQRIGYHGWKWVMW